MKFIHISDLHIGKKINEFSLIEDQIFILKEILNIAKKEKVDAVLISGDVYDKSIPPAEATTVLDDLLTQLAVLNIKVFLISGNHDNSERLSFASRLLETHNIYLSEVFDGSVKKLSFDDDFGKINFFLLPFLKPIHVARFFEEEKITTYDQGIKVVIDSLELKKEERNVLLSHQFVTGSTSSGDEIAVGGVENVNANNFDDFDYVALGHIHRAMFVGRETVRYCGTPLKYSLSNWKEERTLTLVNMKEKGNIEITTLPLTPLRNLREIRGEFSEISALKNYTEENKNDYVHITLTDEEDIVDAMIKLRRIYQNILSLSYDNKRTRKNSAIIGIEKVQEKLPIELFKEFYFMQNNSEMSEEQIEFSVKLLDNLNF